MAFKVLLMIFTIWICFETEYLFTSTENTPSVSACYGTNVDCDHYSIQCPAGQIIQLKRLLAGYKGNAECQSATHCNHSDTCCAYTEGDWNSLFNPKNTYDTYSNCSSKQFCNQVHAPWQLMTSFDFPVATSYVEVGYTCVEESRRINMCQTGNKTGQIVDIFYEGSKDNYNSTNMGKQCQCLISSVNPNQNFWWTVVDIRLESFHKEQNQSEANCSSASLSTPGSASDLECSESRHHYEGNSIFSASGNFPASSTVKVSLDNLFTLDEYDAPKMIWISSGADNGEVQVRCKEGEFEDETTLSPSTTTSQTTPTSGSYHVRTSNVAYAIFVVMFLVSIYQIRHYN